MNTEKKIRVAVLTRGKSLEAWEVVALEKVKALPFVEIVLQVRDCSGQTNIGNTKKKSLFARFFSYNWSRLFWNRWFRKYGNVPATKETPVNGIFDNVLAIEVVPELRGKFSQHFPASDIEKIKSKQPDVILRFGFNILRGDILTVAPHGVWSYHHADHEIIRGGPAGFWEYMRGEHHTGAILQRLTEKLDDGIILRRGYWALVKHSFRENLDSLLMNSSGWIANALIEIHHHGMVRPQSPAVSSKAKVYKYPGNFRMIMFWNVLLGNKIAFHWNNLFSPETWQIGIVNQTLESVMSNGITGEIEWHSAPESDSYYADPFSIVNSDNTRTYICEYFSGKDQRSRILIPASTVCYNPGTHVSFPGIYSLEGVQYILPESSASGKCELVEFGSLEPTIILNEPIVDPVLINHDNLWWLFGHKADDQNNAALFIYYSDSPKGEFHPHALNPVKTDIRNSRSAGEIFRFENKLIRPAQDSAVTYGKAIVMNEIVTLTPTSFEERPIKRIEADPVWEYDKGIHTINAHGDKTLIDAKSFRFNFANFRAQFSRKARRITGK